MATALLVGALGRPGSAHAGASIPQNLAPKGYSELVLAAHKGRPLVVNFWATWCEPCREELPALLSAVKAKKIDLVLISLDASKNRLQVRGFLDSMHLEGGSFIVASGDPQSFIEAIDPKWDGTVPYTLVYKRDGQLAKRLLGAQSIEEFSFAFQQASR
jgi:thiol-disulfide isomerase/thioredoxin